MNMTLQYLVIVLAVLVSAWVVARKQFPGSVKRLRVAIALPLVRSGQPGWVRKLGHRIAPVPEQDGQGGCGGCSSCGPH